MPVACSSVLQCPYRLNDPKTFWGVALVKVYFLQLHHRPLAVLSLSRELSGSCCCPGKGAGVFCVLVSLQVVEDEGEVFERRG